MIANDTTFPYKAVLWDIDGTLADSEPVHLKSFVAACNELNICLPEDFHNHLIGKTDKETHHWLVENCGLNLELKSWNQNRFRHYLHRIDEVKPYSMSLNLWHKLDTLGVMQATVSNSDRIIVQKNLHRLGINRPEFVSVALNDVHEGKPHPEPYIRAAHLLGVAVENCAVVEDSETGGMAGQEAGMDVYMMPWFQCKSQFDHRRFDDLMAFVTNEIECL